MSIIKGYTTGVFDMFHIGHLNLLMNAKKNCEHLIAGVTTDEEVFRLKGKKPIINFEERIKIIESIKYVDEVIPEHSSNKIDAWHNLKFNIIFKGSDWKGSKQWNHYEEFFNKEGVDVVYFQYTEGTSSTKLREILDYIYNNSLINHKF